MDIFIIIAIIAASFAIGHAVGYHRGYGLWDARMTAIETQYKEAQSTLDYLRGIK